MSEAVSNLVSATFSRHADVLESTRSLIPEVTLAARYVAACLQEGRKVLLCGNGGSAADAQHIAAEFVGRFVKERGPLPALALHTNASTLTAVANDYGYESVFEREVHAHGRSGDVLIAISTSGNSISIVRAARAARELGLVVIGLTAQSGGELKALCDVCLCIPTNETARAQEMHILIGHVLCECVDAVL